MLALGAAAGMASAQPSLAQDVEPLKVGVLDVAAKRVIGARDGVDLVYKEFTAEGRDPGRWKTPAGPDHGEVVASTFVEQFRRLDRKRPMVIYAANAFSMKKKDDGSTALSMDYEKAREALPWMKANGVRVVVTAFNTKSKPGSDLLMDEAEKLGMIVFAGGSNTGGAGKVFPAADPRSVSVVDSGPDMALRKDASIASWIDFAMDGTVVTGSRDERSREVGSSYASAKAAAYGSYVVSRQPDICVSDLKKVMQVAARPVSYTIGGQSVQVREIGGHEVDAALVAHVSVSFPRQAPPPATRTAMLGAIASSGMSGR